MENNEVVSEKELENLVLENQANFGQSPVEEAAMKFTRMLPFVKKLAQAMPNGGLSRVIHALAEFPLGPGKPRLLNDAERQLFYLVQELNGAKTIVLQNIIETQKKEVPNERNSNEEEK